MADSEPTHDNPRNTRNLPAVVQEGEVLRPAADNWLIRAIRTLFGWKPGSVRDDLQVVLDASTPDEVGFSAIERTMLRNILGLHERRIADVMIHRADIVAVKRDIPLGELMSLFESAAHSRLVVYNETLDDPEGIVHIRDLLAFMTARARVTEAGKAKRKKPLPAGLDLRAVDLALPLAGRQHHPETAVRAAVDAGDRSAGADAGLAHPSGAGGGRIWRHRRPGLDRGHRRTDRRRDRRRARQRRAAGDRAAGGQFLHRRRARQPRRRPLRDRRGIRHRRSRRGSRDARRLSRDPCRPPAGARRSHFRPRQFRNRSARCRSAAGQAPAHRRRARNAPPPRSRDARAAAAIRPARSGKPTTIPIRSGDGAGSP